MPAKISVCILIILILICGKAAAAPDIIWVIMDQADLDDISNTDTENIDYLQQKGALGLVNVRTADHLQPGSTYLSIGAGTRCLSNQNVHTGENYNEVVINKNIKSLQELNKQNTYNANPGLIGKMLRLHQRNIAVLGNADSSAGNKRTVVSMVMDENGRVPLGDVSDNLLRDSEFAWDRETDWQEMKKQYFEYKKLADVIVIETGDITRIEDMRHRLNDQKLKEYKKLALAEIDEFIGFLIDNIDFNQTVLGLIVPTPSSSLREQGSRLSWCLFTGKKYSHGWLTSLSTRRKGIITISDLAPALLEATNIDIDRDKFMGSVPEVITTRVNWKDLIKLNQKITMISYLRSSFVKGFIILQLLVVTLALVNMFWKNSMITVINKNVVEYLLLTLFLIPINYLIISMFLCNRTGFYILLLLLITIVEITIIVNYIENKLMRVIVIIIPLILIITCDLIGDFSLMADSLLGYSSIIGARYYGIGNEYMGLFIGALLMGVSGFIEYFKKNKLCHLLLKLSLLPIVAGIYLMGNNSLGANFGGMITMIGSGFITLYYLTRKIFSKKFFIIISVMFILFMIVIMYMDYREILAPSSHIGNSIKPILSGNFNYIKQIILRKLIMNIKLLKWTIWTRVLLAFLIYLVIIFTHPVGKLKQVLSRYQYLSAGFYGGISGGFLTMVVNDSGVVAAATILFFPMLTLLYLMQDNNL